MTENTILIDTRKGYGDLSEPGQAMAEFIEISRRYVIETQWSEAMPALKAGTRIKKLRQEVNRRFSAFSDYERAAAVAFRFPRNLMLLHHLREPWEIWLANHLRTFPGDASAFTLILMRFEPFTGDWAPTPEHSAWQMHHDW